MPIAFLTLELHIEGAQSLKDKRQVVRSLKDRLRTHFNVAVAELDSSGLWHRATLGVVSVSDSRDYLDGLVNVSEGQLAGDGRSAWVFVVVQVDDQEAARTMEGLSAAVGFVRRELVERLRLRRAPELIFQLDRSQDYVARIDELLGRNRKRSSPQR